VAGVPRKERRARVSELLDLVEVSHRADRRPAEMSGGEQQRAAIAVGKANSPRVLLADEPTGELDDTTSAHVLEAMRSVNRELGLTTLIVTHDPGVSDHVARTVQIRDGRVSSIEHESSNALEPARATEPPLEVVSFVFSSIVWTFTTGGITHEDTWRGNR
jgi:ABC-type lipoprotein export system ATPase subunit